jgi:hypothetical protein
MVKLLQDSKPTREKEKQSKYEGAIKGLYLHQLS